MASASSPSPGLALEILRASLPLVAAAVAHWVLWVIGRRGPVWLARARGTDLNAAGHLPWRHTAELALMPLKLAVWVLGIYWACEPFLGMRSARSELARLLVTSFTRPLFTVKERAFSALDLLLLPLFLGLLWAAASVLAWLLRTQILHRAGLAASVQEGVSSILRYAVLFFGGIVVLQLWGVDAGTLAIVGSVLGIGIGFGLQNIANNFVSGLLLGLERPIKAGDFVEIAGFTGTVRRIGARSTWIQTQDQVSILIPNSRFLDTEVINWSHENPLSRLRIAFSVAYGSPMSKVRSLVLEVVGRHPDLLRDPRPEVRLVGFGASGLDLQLLAFTRDPQRQERLRSDLNFGIESALRRGGIEIPFNQVDLRLRSATFDRAVERWRRSLPGEDVMEEEPAPTPMGGEPTGIFVVRRWTPEELDSLAARMFAEGGVECADRRHRFQLYPSCFLGNEAVDWLVQAEGLTRNEALEVGNLMMQRGAFHHVLDEHALEDRPLFYRSRAYEQAAEESAAT